MDQLHDQNQDSGHYSGFSKEDSFANLVGLFSVLGKVARRLERKSNEENSTLLPVSYDQEQSDPDQH